MAEFLQRRTERLHRKGMEQSIWTIMMIVLGLVTVIVLLVVISRAFLATHTGAEDHINQSGKGIGCTIACQKCCINSSAAAINCGGTFVKVGGEFCHCEDTKPMDPGC